GTEPTVAQGGELKVNAVVLNRSPAALQIREIRLAGTALTLNKTLPANQPVQAEKVLKVPPTAETSNPYWLSHPGDRGTFQVSEPSMIGLPEEPSALRAEFVIGAGRQFFTVERPIYYKWTDPVGGERYRDIQVVPPVMVNPELSVLVFPDGKSK